MYHFAKTIVSCPVSKVKEGIPKELEFNVYTFMKWQTCNWGIENFGNCENFFGFSEITLLYILQIW